MVFSNCSTQMTALGLLASGSLDDSVVATTLDTAIIRFATRFLRAFIRPRASPAFTRELEIASTAVFQRPEGSDFRGWRADGVEGSGVRDFMFVAGRYSKR